MRGRGLVALLAGGLVLVPAAGAAAHGTMQWPPSRTWTCWTEGPERPVSAACKAAIALRGPQPAYDWNEVNLPDPAGRHRQRIPDGKLCGAGRDKYAGFDLARGDWPATAVTPGPVRFSFAATAAHKGSFELYLTREGYDPTRPLRWADLDPTPFLRATDPPLTGNAYVLTGPLPARSGRHVVYAIWQRSDSPEAFYSCSDVVFGSTPTPSPTVSPTPTPTPSPTPSPSPTHTHGPGTWLTGVQYYRGDSVVHQGLPYSCLQTHISQVDWSPADAPALWLRQGQLHPGWPAR